MTDKAVSALTSLTGATTATGDLLYIVDISEAAAADRSKKITAEELQNYLKKFPATIGVGGATPAASGAGISFPATASASSDANTLDDYEEGNWDPTILYGGSDSGQTYAIQVGRYVKIGNMVHATGYAQVNAATSATGILSMGNLPFASANISNYVPIGIALLDNAASAVDQPICQIPVNSSFAYIVAGTGANNASSLTDTVRAAGFRVNISITYRVS